MRSKNVTAFIQARLTSSRLPNKVLASIGPWTALELMSKRLARSKKIDQTIFVIPANQQNKELKDYLTQKLNVEVFCGDELDVLQRFYDASKIHPSDYYVRLTGDCPLICPDIVDEVIRITLDSNADYGSNAHPPTYPDGFDVECFRFQLLNWLQENMSSPEDREHVTFGLKKAPSLGKIFNTQNIRHHLGDFSQIRLTLDHPQDLEVVRKLYDKLDAKLADASGDELIEVYKLMDLAPINSIYRRNQMLEN